MDSKQVVDGTDFTPERMFRAVPSPRWVRVEFGGQFIADSKRTLLVWDNHFIPTYFFPREDVDMTALEPTCGQRGERTTYHISVGDNEARNAAWSYTAPVEERTATRDYIAFRWEKMDAWYEEAEQVFVHARDPYHRVDTVASSRHIRVEWAGNTIAESEHPYLLFETHLPTRYYLPKEAVNHEFLIPSETTTSCPYKGRAVYWSIKVGDQMLKDVVWSYPEPIPEAPKIEGLLAFYNEKLDIFLDGELEPKPQTAWS